MAWVIYADALAEAEWFKARSEAFSTASIEMIQRNRDDNPDYVNRLIEYDRPDIILVWDGTPKLVLEKTREVPTGHNVGQRFSRLVNAAEENVPAIMFMPARARKHGKYASLCNIPKRLFTSFERMEEIHGTPILLVNWPADDDGELIEGGHENDELDRLIQDLIRHDFNFRESVEAGNIRNRMLQIQNGLDDATNELPPSVHIYNTNTYVNQLQNHFSEEITLPRGFIQREETLVYTIKMTENASNRQDPYVGQQWIYDYQFCRSGISPDDKNRNLVLRFPYIHMRYWMDTNPNIPNTKDALWYITANLLEFPDGVHSCR